MSVPETSDRHKEAYRDCVRALIALHKLMRAGRGETPQADELRSEMDEFWPHLSDEEVRSIEGMSADLYTLEANSPIVHPQERGIFDPRLAAAVREAKERSDSSAVLKFLREQPTLISADRAAGIRGLEYSSLNETEVAALFFAEAYRLSANGLRVALFLLDSWLSLRHFDEVVEFVERDVLCRRDIPADLLAAFASVLFRAGEESTGKTPARAYQTAIQCLDRALDQITHETHGAHAGSLPFLCHMARVACLVRLDAAAKAVHDAVEASEPEMSSAFRGIFQNYEQLITNP